MSILRKIFYFKIKEINLKNNKMYEVGYKAKQNHKIEFFYFILFYLFYFILFYFDNREN